MNKLSKNLFKIIKILGFVIIYILLFDYFGAFEKYIGRYLLPLKISVLFISLICMVECIINFIEIRNVNDNLVKKRSYYFILVLAIIGIFFVFLFIKGLINGNFDLV
jgi:hypothetical protein